MTSPPLHDHLTTPPILCLLSSRARNSHRSRHLCDLYRDLCCSSHTLCDKPLYSTTLLPPSPLLLFTVLPHLSSVTSNSVMHVSSLPPLYFCSPSSAEKARRGRLEVPQHTTTVSEEGANASAETRARATRGNTGEVAIQPPAHGHLVHTNAVLVGASCLLSGCVCKPHRPRHRTDATALIVCTCACQCFTPIVHRLRPCKRTPNAPPNCPCCLRTFVRSMRLTQTIQEESQREQLEAKTQQLQETISRLKDENKQLRSVGASPSL